MNLDFALVVVAVVAITAMALTIGTPRNLRALESFLKKLLMTIGRFRW